MVVACSGTLLFFCPLMLLAGQIMNTLISDLKRQIVLQFHVGNEYSLNFKHSEFNDDLTVQLEVTILCWGNF